MKAIWNDVVIAESDQTIVVEGNHYFPPDAVKMEYFQNSNTISVDGKANPDGAWYYPDAKPAAKNIQGYVAFWRGVRVEK
jgi:uncharacterized protein (DUF427 family)